MDSASKGTSDPSLPIPSLRGFMGLPKTGKAGGLAVALLTSIHSHKTRWKVPSYGSRARTSGTGEPTTSSPRWSIRGVGVARMPIVGRMAQEANAEG